MSLQRKRRLWSKNKLRMPKPGKGLSDKGFTLRLISEGDGRFAVVKELTRLLQQLKEDAALVSVQQEVLAVRAVFLVAYLESLGVPRSFAGAPGARNLGPDDVTQVGSPFRCSI
jgi:hypothetical protein